MGEKTNIEWCDSTINPTTGCDGCELWNGRDIRTCYAGNLHEARLAKSLPILYAENFQEVRIASGRMAQAARWPDLRGKDRPGKPWLNGFPRMIFVGDMGDFMSREVPDDYIENEIIGAIRSPEGSRHFWLLLTKQIRRLADLSLKIGGLPDNCMAMTTVTDQTFAKKRIPDLIKVKCRWRGVSAEPLWGPVDFSEWMTPGGEALDSRDYYPDAPPGVYDEYLRCHVTEAFSEIDWVITGGESEQSGDTQTKPSHPQWFRDIRDQCTAAGVPIFHKQNGDWWPSNYDATSPEWIAMSKASTSGQNLNHNGSIASMFRVGKARAGRLLDGVEWNEMPDLPSLKGK